MSGETLVARCAAQWQAHRNIKKGQEVDSYDKLTLQTTLTHNTA